MWRHAWKKASCGGEDQHRRDGGVFAMGALSMNDDGMCVFWCFGYIVGFLVATIAACGCLEPAVLAARAGERVRPPSIGATKWMWVALGDWVEGRLSHLARCAVFARLRALIIGKKRERRA